MSTENWTFVSSLFQYIGIGSLALIVGLWISTIIGGSLSKFADLIMRTYMCLWGVFLIAFSPQLMELLNFPSPTVVVSSIFGISLVGGYLAGKIPIIRSFSVHLGHAFAVGAVLTLSYHLSAVPFVNSLYENYGDYALLVALLTTSIMYALIRGVSKESKV